MSEIPFQAEIIVGSDSKGFQWLKKKVFAILAKNVYSITAYYRIPGKKLLK